MRGFFVGSFGSSLIAFTLIGYAVIPDIAAFFPVNRGHFLVLNSSNMVVKISHFYTYLYIFVHMSVKREITRMACLLRFLLVGTGGLEPPTPTVSR